MFDVPALPPLPAYRLFAVAVALTLLAPTVAVSADGGGTAGRESSVFVEPGLEYVAIAPSQLARYLGPLIEWKMDRGVSAQIFDLGVILTVYEGRDDAERLHNFLQDLYYNHTEGTPRWLLLAGDPDQVPVRYLWADRDHSGSTVRERNLYIGDTYYSGLETDWDADGDDVFGEPGEEDLTPELYVGRISADLPEELEAAVAKVLSYEMDPPTGDWYLNAFLAGALMDEPNRLDNPYTLPGASGYSDEGFDPHTDNAYETTQKVRAVLGEGYDLIELADYPFFEGCRYTAENDTLNHEASAAAWNRGNAFVFWASHGYEAFGGLAEYSGTGTSDMFESARPFITVEDTVVNNTGGMLPLVYISSCYSGQYDKADPTNFETMITSPEGGAIALVAGDGDTFRLENISTESFGNWWLSERFWQLVIDEGLVRPGEALGTLKSEYHTYYLTEGPPVGDGINMDYFYANLYSYNLLGDPEVPVWVGEPRWLDLEVVGGAVFNSPALKVLVTDRDTGEPVEGATVHVRGAGLEGIVEVTTGADGTATIAPGPRVMGEELRLTVTKDNCVPDRLIMNVGEGVLEASITDGRLLGPTSEDFGEEALEFTTSVRNNGDFPLTSLKVEFDSGDINAQADNRTQTRQVNIGLGEVVMVTFTHRYIAPGQYDVVVRVDPDDTLSETNELDNEAALHLDLNALPTLPDSIGPIMMMAGEVLSPPLDLRGYVTFPEGNEDDVAFVLGDVTQGVMAWIDGRGELLILPNTGFGGPGTLEVMMYRQGVLTDEMDVDIEVKAVNAPPIIVEIADQEATVGGPLEVYINASDPDGDNLQFSTTLPDAVIGDSTLRWTPGAGDVGERFPAVYAMDTHGARTEMRFRLSVMSGNSEPSIQAFEDKVTVEEGGTVYVPVSAQDADGDPLLFHLASPDEGFSIDPVTGLLVFDASGAAPGTYSAMVIVTDGIVSVQRTIEVTVEESGSVPALVLLVAGVIMVAVVAALVMTRR